MSSSRTEGFTLIELLVVVAVIAILAAWAVPSFSQLSARNTLNTQTDRLWQAISTARLEAAERRTRVRLCPTQDKMTCSNDWQGSLLLFEDVGDFGKRNTNERLIRLIPATNSAVVIEPTDTVTQGISFNPDGFTSHWGHFKLCHPEFNGGTARKITISKGRILREHEVSEHVEACQPQQS